MSKIKTKLLKGYNAVKKFAENQQGGFGVKEIAITIAIIIVIGLAIGVIEGNLEGWVGDIWEMFMEEINDRIQPTQK